MGQADEVDFLREGRTALAEGQTTRAVSLLKAAVAAAPGGVEARRLLCRAHLSAEQVREAEVCLREGLARRPEEAALWLDLGRLLAKGGKHNEATRALEKAIRLAPGEAEAVLALGEIYEHHGERQAAGALYRSSLSKVTGARRLRLHRRLARLALSEGRQDEAMDMLRQALALAASQGAALVGELKAELGEILHRAGRPSEATEALAEAVRLRPSDGKARLLYGRVLGELEDHRGAVSQLAEASRLLPGRPEPLAALTKSHLALGDREAAYTSGIAALALDPLSAEIQWLVVPLYMERGLHGPASELLDGLVGVRGHDPGFWELRARVAEARADHGAAREAYAKALTLRPRDHGLQRSLAFAARRAGDYESALKHLEAILARDPGDYDALVHRGIALELTGQRPGARLALGGARQGQPTRPEAHVYLAWLSLREGRPALALAAAQEGDRLAEGKSAHALDVLAKALAALGRGKDAVAALDRALALSLGAEDRAYFQKERETLAAPSPEPSPRLPPP